MDNCAMWTHQLLAGASAFREQKLMSAYDGRVHRD